MNDLPIDYTSVIPFWQSFHSMMISDGKIAQKHVNDLKWFHGQVHNRGPWDLKQFLHASYLLHGPEIYSGADLGNILYGYVGLSAGFTEGLLLKAAGWAQTEAGTSSPKFVNSNWDDPRDQAMIKLGFALHTMDVKNGYIKYTRVGTFSKIEYSLIGNLLNTIATRTEIVSMQMSSGTPTPIMPYDGAVWP